MSLLEFNLKSTVMSEFDAVRLKAERKEKSPPEMAKLWKIIHKQFELIDIKNARKCSLLGTADTSKDLKRKFGETINTVSTDHENRSTKQPCFYFEQHGNCRFGDSCRYSHHTTDVQCDAKPVGATVKNLGKGRGKGFGKGNSKGKGKIGKGGKDAGRATESKDRSAFSYCDRCYREHMGLVGDNCVQPPCRFCISEQLEDSDHHLRECQHKPEHWQFCPEVPAVTLRNGSKRELTTRVNTALNSGKKQKPMTAMELVTSLSVNELTEVCAAINTRQNEDDATSAVVEQESEAIQVLTKLNRTTPVAKSAGSTLKGGDTTHLVPVTATGMKATATIGSVIRTPQSEADQREFSLKIAQAKVNESRGRGFRNGLYSVSVDEAPERTPLFDTYDEWFAKRKV